MRPYHALMVGWVFLASSFLFADTLHVPQDYPTLQAAIDAAAPGDAVLAAAGTYFENISFLGKAITVMGGEGAEQWVIDGGQSGSVVTFDGGEGPDSILQGFTITNGSGTDAQGPTYPKKAGGGIYCVHASPTIRENIIRDNRIQVGGGTWSEGAGIYCEDASPHIENNQILSNAAEGLVALGGGLHCVQASPVVTGNRLSENSVGSHYCYGGGFSGEQGSASFLSGNLISRNEAVCPLGYTAAGGGLAFLTSSSPTIVQNTIEYNAASVEGGGVWFYDGCSGTLSENSILHNKAGDPYVDCDAAGGGVLLLNASVLVTKNLIAYNTATGSTLFDGNGGGLYAGGPVASAVTDNVIAWNTCTFSAGGLCLSNWDGLLAGNLVLENSSVSRGGGIFLENFAAPEITSNLILNNHSQGSGGGLYVRMDAHPELCNCIIAKNTAVSQGGALYGSSFDYSNVRNCTFFGNTAGEAGGGLYLTYKCDIKVYNSILWSDEAPTGKEIYVGGSSQSTLALWYSDVEGGSASTYTEPGSTINWKLGMIDADPLFADTARDDYHLTYDSPCRDHGRNSDVTEEFDFEGDPRIAWNGKVDMGADEFHTHLYYTGEATPGGDIEAKLVGLPQTWPVGLFFGSGVLEDPLASSWGDFWLEAPWLPVPLVPIPSSGILVIPATVPMHPPAPWDLPMQGLVGLSPDSLTNLLVLKVR